MHKPAGIGEDISLIFGNTYDLKVRFKPVRESIQVPSRDFINFERRR